MRKIIASIAAAALLCGCQGVKTAGDGELPVVDVAGALASPVDLKVSDLGSKISYIPLETNDSSLIGNQYILRAENGALFVIGMDPWGLAAQNCKAFRLSDGGFIASIGHAGQDPQAWSSPVPTMTLGNPDVLYFYSYVTDGAKAQKYSLDGQYLGVIRPGAFSRWGSAVMDTTVLTVSSLVYDNSFGMQLMRSGLNSPADTITVYPMPQLPSSRSWNGVAMTAVHGVMLNSQTVFMHYRVGDKNTYESMGMSRQMWFRGSDVRFKPSFVDTLYNVTPSGMEKAYVFNTGEKGVDYRTMNIDGIQKDNLMLCEVLETPDKIIFGASIGWMNGDHKSYMGYYDKSSGKAVATDASKGFVDDLEGFMPFNPVLTTPDGDLIGFLKIEDIIKWTEEHPDVELPASLQDMPDDANPVIVVVSK